MRIPLRETKELISSTPNAHADFVKTFHVFPSLRLLVSGSSDKIVRFWYVAALIKPFFFTRFGTSRDISQPENTGPLRSVGSISAHTRPVECLDGQALSENSAILYTGDTMGVIKVWDLQKINSSPLRWATTLKDTINHHRTRINELMYHQNGHLWTGIFAFSSILLNCL